MWATEYFENPEHQIMDLFEHSKKSFTKLPKLSNTTIFERIYSLYLLAEICDLIRRLLL